MDLDFADWLGLNIFAGDALADISLLINKGRKLNPPQITGIQQFFEECNRGTDSSFTAMLKDGGRATDIYRKVFSPVARNCSPNHYLGLVQNLSNKDADPLGQQELRGFFSKMLIYTGRRLGNLIQDGRISDRHRCHVA